MKYIDATNMIYGRLSSVVAKDLLAGESVKIVNADKCVITGSKPFVLNHFKERREIGSVRKGPHYPRTPDQILRRSIKNMLPSKKTTGKEALKRCMVYCGVPEDLKGMQFETVEKAMNKKLSNYLTLSEISLSLGYKVKN
jgi:large subunit ribosomal protein L13